MAGGTRAAFAHLSPYFYLDTGLKAMPQHDPGAGARRHRETARQHSTTLREQALYAGKLARRCADTASPVRN